MRKQQFHIIVFRPSARIDYLTPFKMRTKNGLESMITRTGVSDKMDWSL